MNVAWIPLCWCIGYVIAAGIHFEKSIDSDDCTSKTGQLGKCVNIHDCPYAQTLIQKNIPPTVCNFEGNTTIVCCIETEERSPIRTAEPGIRSAMKCKEYYPYPKQFILIGAGKPSLVQEFPHMAVIGFGKENDIRWQCGGSLISETFVLTAAHCLNSIDLGDAKWVRLGDLDLATDKDQAEPQQFSIRRRIPHPNYETHLRYHDIALIELDRKVKISLYVSMACLDTLRQHNESQMIATGWGQTEFISESSSFLLKTDLDIVNHDKCRPFYAKSKSILPNGILDDGQICAGGGREQDTCQGDSGGPLQVKNKRVYSSLKVYDIVGITSFGKGCGLSDSPGIYTRVYNYLSWIEDIVWPSA